MSLCWMHRSRIVSFPFQLLKFLVLTRNMPKMIVSKMCSGNNVMFWGHTVAAACLYWKLRVFLWFVTMCERWL